MLTGDKLQVVWAEFSTLSYSACVMGVIGHHVLDTDAGKQLP
jgi:hypothetical protein